MSVFASAWAWERRLPSATQKLILLACADAADDSGVFWLRQKRIAEKCGTCSKTVQRTLLAFEKSGLLTKAERFREDGGRSSNRYTLALPATATLRTDDPGGVGDNQSPGVESPVGQDTQVSKGLGTLRCPGERDSAMSQQEPPPNHNSDPRKRTTTVRPVDKQLSAWEQRSLLNLTTGLTEDARGELLSQLSKKLSCGEVRAPVAWVRAAVYRIKAQGDLL